MSYMKRWAFDAAELIFEVGLKDEEVLIEMKSRPIETPPDAPKFEPDDEWMICEIANIRAHPEIWDYRTWPFPEIYPEDPDVQDQTSS